MNVIGYTFNVWLPILTHPAKEVPRFKKGFSFSVAGYVAQMGTVAGLVVEEAEEIEEDSERGRW
ncbi:hypothetical protein BJ875DRAFT_463195 [Amylocarpus encephaloides]|uniref:Uncharacterized protein n=1 Tax=Amylocarpus encephaloides TaxID=45428 RepID=A0A9P7YIH4_9HELO|nr:hypothetical protein BJ875DRAFT_463195 [Amylocarpus encephaloides]